MTPMENWELKNTPTQKLIDKLLVHLYSDSVKLLVRLEMHLAMSSLRYETVRVLWW